MLLRSETSPSATCMPSRAKASAMARPSPLAAPVTAATLPLNSFMRLPPRMPQHECAAEKDEPFHEQDVQVHAHARDQPGGRGAARDAGEADHHPDGEGLRV